MTNYETAQTAQIYPTRAEAAMMLTFMAILIITLGATLRSANYEPECTPAIVTIKETM